MSRYIAIPLVLAMVTAACATGGDGGPASATATGMREASLIDGTGKAIGTVSLRENAAGTTIMIDAAGLRPGVHGLHVHEVGSCSLPDFKSAGGHLNPSGKQHGRDNPNGAHLGDLTSLNVAANGNGHADFQLAGTTLAQLIDADGIAVVVHADPDDYKTDPSGNSGARIACAAFN